MRKESCPALYVFLIVALSIFLSSCVTLGWSPRYVPQRQQEFEYDAQPIVYEADQWEIAIVVHDEEWASMAINNNTPNVISIEWDARSWTTPWLENVRIVPEGTIKMDSSRSLPPLVVAPGTVIVKDFTSQPETKFTEESLNGSTFVIGYQIRGQTGHAVVKIDSVDLGAPDPAPQDEVLGWVEESIVFIHPLFIAMPSSQRTRLKEKASETAKKEYGENIILDLVSYKSEWHPTSLLIAFSLYGWVEIGTIEARVIRGPA